MVVYELNSNADQSNQKMTIILIIHIAPLIRHLLYPTDSEYNEQKRNAYSGDVVFISTI